MSGVRALVREAAMSLLESEHRRSRHAQRKSQKQQRRKARRPASAARPFSLAGFENDDNRVLTFRQWCILNGISARTGRRILASGTGPVVTQLSERRIGISVGNNRRWQESRERA
jgi:hypothetical protein